MKKIIKLLLLVIFAACFAILLSAIVAYAEDISKMNPIIASAILAVLPVSFYWLMIFMASDSNEPGSKPVAA